MHRLRLVVTVAVIGMTTAAIGAAPVTKRLTTAKVAPPQPSVPLSGTDVAQPTISTDVGLEQESAPLDLSSPSPELVPSPVPTSAGVSGGDPINMNWYSINNGGAIEVAAGNIKMGLSIGQNAVGEVSAGNIKMGLGFWYGAGTGSTPSCVCDCHADPECDGFTDILDVSALVSVAFRDGAPLPDPNGLCPYQTTDVDCSGFTDILDVSRVVEVAFRNGNPAAEFCSPCAPIL